MARGTVSLKHGLGLAVEGRHVRGHGLIGGGVARGSIGSLCRNTSGENQPSDDQKGYGQIPTRQVQDTPPPGGEWRYAI